MILSFDEFVKKSGGTPESVKPVAASTSPNVLSQLAAPTLTSKLKDRVSNVKTAVKQGVEAGKDNSPQNFSSGATKMINAGASIPGQAIGAIGDVIGAGIEKTGLNEPIAKAMKPIVESDPVKKLTEFYHSLPKETQELLGNATNIASVIPVVKGGQVAKETVESGIETGINTIKTGVNAVTDKVKPVIDATKGAYESASRVPDRIKTNLAEKQAKEADINSLPSDHAKTAVRDGVDITDVKTLPEVAKGSQAKKLIQTVRDFAQGKSKVDPIEVVGEPIIKKVKDLDKIRKEVGAKLGEASKTIGVLTKPELVGGVLNKLKSVPGLEALQLNPKGLLNFKGTNLESALSKPDRKAIQEAFNEATKWGNGEKAHLFRQTLFETLGGKKKSLANITDTQERAFDAIRSGLSDVIEGKSSGYKAVSNEYRKIMEPLGELRKLMKNIDPNSTDDILNMSAGLLARRITSAAASNPQVRQLLKKLDDAVPGGTTKESVTQLQDLYNILNKYYDIAPKTGFQNLVKEGVGASDTLTGMAKETIKNVAGRSNAVRQKALEDLLDSFNSGAVPETALKEALETIAPKAKVYIDDLVKDLIEGEDAIHWDAPNKTFKSALPKLINEKEGDVLQMHDLARTSAVANTPEARASLVEKLSKQDLHAPPLHQTPDIFAGYEGYLFKVKTPTGLVSEVQVISPEMMYGKAPLSESLRILGKEKVDEIRRRTGAEPELGHKIYEEIKSMTPAEKISPEGKRKLEQLRQQSIDYYSKLR